MGNDRDLKYCFWIVEDGEVGTVEAWQVGVNDSIRRVENVVIRRKRFRWHWAKVLGKSEADNGQTVILGIEEGIDSCSLLVRKRNSLLMICRPMPCDARICECHRREVDDGYFYCMDHWNAWQEVK